MSEITFNNQSTYVPTQSSSQGTSTVITIPVYYQQPAFQEFGASQNTPPPTTGSSGSTPAAPGSQLAQAPITNPVSNPGSGTSNSGTITTTTPSSGTSGGGGTVTAAGGGEEAKDPNSRNPQPAPAPAAPSCTKSIAGRSQVTTSATTMQQTYTFPSSNMIKTLSLPAASNVAYSVNGQSSASGQALVVDLSPGTQTIVINVGVDRNCQSFSVTPQFTNTCDQTFSDWFAYGSESAWKTSCN